MALIISLLISECSFIHSLNNFTDCLLDAATGTAAERKTKPFPLEVHIPGEKTDNKK